MMLLGRARALIAHHPLPDLHALHQVQLLELVEDPIDARAADAPPTWAGLGALNVRLTPVEVDRISAAIPIGAAAGLRYPEAGMRGVYV